MIRVATFNLNNLFDRFNFHAAITERPRVRTTYRWRLDENRDVLPPPEPPVLLDAEDVPIVEGIAPVHIELGPMGRLVQPKPPAHRDALLMRTDRLNADVLAVQEVENIAALREFNALLDAPYPYLVLIEGNDPRFIDVGVLSRLPIGSATSHRWLADPNDPQRFLFSRDLLVVEVFNLARDEALFTLWVNHLKSKFIDPDITDPEDIAQAQAANDARRKRQAQGVHDIIADVHDAENDPFIVCGDLNDAPGSDPLSPLSDGNLHLQDVFAGGVNADNIDFERPENEGPRVSNVEDVPPNEDWTHRFACANAPDLYERLDHMLVSSSLADRIAAARIQRRTHWTKTHAGSDHDPIVIDLDIEP